MKRFILAVLFIVLFVQIGVSQSFDKEKLDAYFNVLDEGNKFMGSVAVSQNGSIIYSNSIGFADLENQTKASEITKYRIGSISKTFTAVLVLKSTEEDKLSLDQTIDKWFPAIINANKITVSNLLNHRSGIHSFTNDDDYLNWNTFPKTEREMLEIILKGGSDFAPDEKVEYSNSNYVLLTYILEKVYNKSYSDLLRDYISKPLGLTNTYVFGKINPENHEAKSYYYLGDWNLYSETDYTIPVGAGAIISTPTDLTKFADALFSGKLLNDNSLNTMKTVKEGYGLGLFQIPFDDKIGYGHNGSIDGFSSILINFEKDNMSFALISNGSNYDINNISLAVLSAVYDVPYELPTFTSYNHTLEELDQFIGVYSTPEIPLKITISRVDNMLFAQATNQSEFPLEAIDKRKFSFVAAGIVIEFDTTEKSLILNQGGVQSEFIKE